MGPGHGWGQLDEADASALKAMCFLLSGCLMGGDLSPRVVRKLGSKFANVGLLQDSWGDDDLRAGLDLLGMRLNQLSGSQPVE